MAAGRSELDGLAFGDNLDDPPLLEAGHSLLQDESTPQSPLVPDTSSLSEGHSYQGLKLLYSSAGHVASEDDVVGIE